ncbi:MAG: hypothetical protein RLZZ366_1816, partial [Pseudomonadota bacterium]
MLKFRLGRYTVFILCILVLILALIWFLALPTMSMFLPQWWWLPVPILLVLIGTYDVLQTRHSILRNYPVIGHIRWLVEMIRPEIRQYLLEDEDDATPFSRAQRSLAYQRAKGVSSDHPFGTLMDVYANDYEYLQHSMRPATPVDPKSIRIHIGNEQCKLRYSASVFNVSAMSFGALSANAIRA